MIKKANRSLFLLTLILSFLLLAGTAGAKGYSNAITCFDLEGLTPTVTGVVYQEDITKVTHMPMTTPEEFAGGDGSAENPYRITKLEHLSNMRNYPDKHYVLMKDLDFNDESDYMDTANKSAWTSGEGWAPVGTSGEAFTGSFDARFHSISNLMINRTAGYQGLFGYIGSGAEVKNGGLKNVSITGRSYTGSLAGYNNGVIENWGAQGSVRSDGSGVIFTGGLVGYNYGVIEKSYFSGDVSTNHNVCGGLAGVNRGEISNCYATGSVSAGQIAGGLVGSDADGEGETEYSYAAGSVSGEDIGGLVGDNRAMSNKYTNSYYDKNTAGTASDNNKGIPRTTSEMKTRSTYSGWDFVKIWGIKPGINSGYPYLRFNEKVILGFSFEGLEPAVNGVIDEEAKTISLTVPYGTDVTGLVPTILYAGETVSPASGEANDFTGPVTYTVTASDGSTQDYTVTVTIKEAGNIATVTSDYFAVSAAGTETEEIINIPEGMKKTEFLAKLAKGQEGQSWDDAGLSDPVVNGNRLVVTSEDGTFTVTYTLSVQPEFAGGDGSEESPYRITKLEHLSNIRRYLDKHFVLVSDLDFGSDGDYQHLLNKTIWTTGAGWSPIGGPETANRFTGDFNGNGKTIKGLMIDRPASNTNNYQGLFGYADKQARIYNGRLTDVNVSGAYYVGALAGYCYGEIDSFGVEGRVYGANETGGLVGTCFGSIRNSYSAAAVQGGGPDIGGLVGFFHADSRERVIENCYTTGNVNGVYRVGGLMGYILKGTIRVCYTEGNVTGNDDVGGLAGLCNGTKMAASYATGDVDGNNKVGGLNGRIAGGAELIDCYATGIVLGYNEAGGLIGLADNSTISRAYSVGGVDEKLAGYYHDFGGLIGKISNSPTVAHSYYDSITSGRSDTGKGIPANTAQMKEIETFEGWTFNGTSAVWGIVNTPTHYSYPFLLNNVQNPKPGYKAREPKTITGFSFEDLSPAVTGVIDARTNTISLTVPGGTDLKALVPDITYTGVDITPEPGVAQDFSRPVIYTVTAADGSTRDYLVRVGFPGSGGRDRGRKVTNTLIDGTEIEISGQVIKDMGTAGEILEIVAGPVTYSIPASYIDMDAISGQFGQDIRLSDIRVEFRISKPPEDTVRLIEEIAGTGNLQLVMEPIEFEITCTYGGKTVELDRFSGFVERTVALPDNVDPAKVTTAVVLNGDGTFSHVPTRIVEMNGSYYAVISSLTNSTYSIIWNTMEFSDVAGHWARELVTDMGKRLVIGGVGEGLFAPDRDISRAEFAAIMVRALGLKPETADNPFNDVPETAWYGDCIKAAYQYGIVSGDKGGWYRPMDTITREQAMTIIARSMKLVGLDVQPGNDETEKILSQFRDKNDISAYAKTGIAACIKAGIVSGRDAGFIAPRDSITRAEAATIIQRLLQKTNLI